MNINRTPEKIGQICKIESSIANFETDKVYIVTEDPKTVDDRDLIIVVELKDLQRNIDHPNNVKRLPISKKELIVIGDDLASYILSWNAK